MGRIDVERAAELQPDLVVGDWWPVEKAYGGTEAGVEARSRKIAELAPMVGAAGAPTSTGPPTLRREGRPRSARRSCWTYRAGGST